MQGVRDYIKFIKRGYSRPSHLVAIDVRNGVLKKEEGLKFIQEYEGKRPPSLDLFLEFIGLTEKEFLEIAMSHKVSPYDHAAKTTLQGEKMADHDQWCTEGAMNRTEAKVQVDRWKSCNGCNA